MKEFKVKVGMGHLDDPEKSLGSRLETDHQNIKGKKKSLLKINR